MKRKNMVWKTSLDQTEYHVLQGLRGKSNMTARQAAHDKAVKNKTMEDAWDFWIVVTMNAAHDEFGFGTTRLQRLYDKIVTISSCIGAGTVTFKELQRFIACDFDEKRYEKMYGPRTTYDPKKADELLNSLVRISLPAEKLNKLKRLALRENKTVNQMLNDILNVFIERLEV